MDVAIFLYRVSVHETSGFSPFHAIYGREPKLPLDLFFSDELSFETQAYYVDMIGKELHKVYKHIKFNQARVAERNRAYQNDREGRYDVQFYRGDTVLLWVAGERPSRHQNHWNGPYRILKQLNAVEYLIEVPFKNTVQHRRVNVNRLRLYCFWEDGRPSVMRRDSLTEHERNKVQQFTKKAKIGKLAVLINKQTFQNRRSFCLIVWVSSREMIHQTRMMN